MLQFDRLDSRASGAVVEIEFDARVLRYGTRFDGRVLDSLRPLDVPQSVQPGDATIHLDGDGVSIRTQAAQARLLRVEPWSAVLSRTATNATTSPA